jgi:hypothetical protein
VNRAGSAKELDLGPCDFDTAHRRAERVAALVGRIVAPKLARGGAVIVIAIETGAEVERIPVKIPRRKAATPKPAATPLTDPDAIQAEKHRRYSVLRSATANRLGWKLHDAAANLLEMIEQFEIEAHSGVTWWEFRTAGIDPDMPLPGATGSEWSADFFDPLFADVTGFEWSLGTFINLVRCGLARRPEEQDSPTPARRSRKAVKS